MWVAEVKGTGTVRTFEGSSTEAHVSRDHGDVFGPMSDTPAGTSPNTQMDKNVPAGNDVTKPGKVYGVRNTLKFRDIFRGISSRELVTLMENEVIILVVESDDGFRSTISAQRSLGEREGLSSTPFTPQGPMRHLLLKYAGKQMAETDI
jgi:hypothetical protein